MRRHRRPVRFGLFPRFLIMPRTAVLLTAPDPVSLLAQPPSGAAWYHVRSPVARPAYVSHYVLPPRQPPISLVGTCGSSCPRGMATRPSPPPARMGPIPPLSASNSPTHLHTSRGFLLLCHSTPLRGHFYSPTWTPPSWARPLPAAGRAGSLPLGLYPSSNCSSSPCVARRLLKSACLGSIMHPEPGLGCL